MADELGDFMREVMARHVAANPRDAVISCRMATIPADHIWITRPSMDTVEDLLYRPDNTLH